MPSDYTRVERAIRFIEAHAAEQPTLEQIAASSNLSPFHFQRLFSRWAGITPKRFLQFLTLEHARALLEERHSLIEAAMGVGLSGTGRLHDLFVSLTAMTPGEYRSGGAGLHIRYGVHPSPFGDALVAACERGICRLSFLSGEVEEPLAELKSTFPGAAIEASKSFTAPFAARAFASRADGRRGPLPLLVGGTPFQVKVWEALLAIPAGHVATYGDVARAVGQERAARAVGSAIGDNPIAFLIPCHRVIRSTGAFGDYRWGSARKRAMLAWESARFGRA